MTAKQVQVQSYCKHSRASQDMVSQEHATGRKTTNSMTLITKYENSMNNEYIFYQVTKVKLKNTSIYIINFISIV